MVEYARMAELEQRRVLKTSIPGPRSIELMAEKVAPALGWMRDETASVRRVA